MINPRTVLLWTAAVAALLIGRAATAQPATRTVAVALVDTLSQRDARAEILRFSDPARSDVILLPRATASAEDLAAAIASYRRSSARTPSRPGLVGRILVTSQQTRSTPATAPLRALAARTLAGVRQQPWARVGNYGRGQWLSMQVRLDD